MPSRVLKKGDTIQFQVNGEPVDFDESQWTLNDRSVLTNFKEHFKLSTATCKEFEKDKFLLTGVTSKSNAALIGGVALASTMAFSFWNRKVLMQFFNNPSQMGEIAPLSSTTVNALLEPLTKRLEINPSVKVLEVGAGSGGITKKLVELKKKYKEMEVTIVEMNPAFEPVLEDIIKGSNVQLKMGDYTTLIDKGGPFDFIISTLPEQSLSASIVNKITDTMFKDLKEAGFLTRVRYVLKLRWIAPFFKKEKADNIREAFRISSEFDAKHKAESKLILWNIPPTYVSTIRKPS
jgi:phospholipid N-methyltransferase